MEKSRPHALIRRMVLSAAPPKALETMRSLKIEFRELPLAELSAEVPSAASESHQLIELMEFFGSAKPE
jgi:hypothetical protein